MIRYKLCFLFSLMALVLLSSNASSQVLVDYDKALLENRSVLKTKPDQSVERSSGTLKILLNALFLGYKSFVSSQDASSCNFHPSCSVYFVKSVGGHGFIKGSLLFGDRFQRCNSLNRKNYPLYPNTTLLYDPIPSNHDHTEPE
jgi:putative component of membrane protein insertase Oxa1/YidC/SpoIIIJ protein YidD